SAHTPDLHSFPTRRSSDLSTRRETPAKISHDSRAKLNKSVPRRWNGFWVKAGSEGRRTSPRFGMKTPRWFATSRILEMFGVPHRSEEHTSELQSRFDLVCR